MAGSAADTPTVVVVLQPPASVYVILVVPGVLPITVPDDEPIEATEGALLLQVPPVIPSDSVMVKPGHTSVVPLMGVGDALTVIG
jgi:hypothetical protein